MSVSLTMTLCVGQDQADAGGEPRGEQGETTAAETVPGDRTTATVDTQGKPHIDRSHLYSHLRLSGWPATVDVSYSQSLSLSPGCGCSVVSGPLIAMSSL